MSENKKSMLGCDFRVGILLATAGGTPMRKHWRRNDAIRTETLPTTRREVSEASAAALPLIQLKGSHIHTTFQQAHGRLDP